LFAVAVTAAALVSPGPGHSQDCPADVVGAWTGTLPAHHGFLFEFTVRRVADGTFEAEIRSGGELEVVRAWSDGARLRFQSARQPVAFSGSPSADGSRFAGFVQYTSHVTRLVLPAVDPGEGSGVPTWAASWTPLGVPDEELRLDLYIDDDGEGGLGGYFFFRDQRMTGLWGYGLECSGDHLELGEKNLGLWFEGRLTSAGTLDLVGATAGASFPMVFERMREEEVPDSGDTPEAPARAPGTERYAERAPDLTDDGWGTASPSDVGIDPVPIGDLVRAVVEGDLSYTHGMAGSPSRSTSMGSIARPCTTCAPPPRPSRRRSSDWRCRKGGSKALPRGPWRTSRSTGATQTGIRGRPISPSGTC